MLSLSLFLMLMSPEPRTYTLIVGVNQARDTSLSPLSYADDDAARYHEILSRGATQAWLLTSFDDDSQRLFQPLVQEAHPATVSGLKQALTSIQTAMRADVAEGRAVDFVFVYVGHGQKRTDGTAVVHLQDGVLTRQELYDEVIAPVPEAYKHLIVDACEGYYLLNHRGAAPDDDAGPGVAHAVQAFLENSDWDAYPRVGSLFAMSATGETHEWSGFRAGLFSHQVRSGLRGAADVNADHAIAYSELAAFVAAANARLSDPGVQLHVFVHPPKDDRNRPLVRLGGRFLRFGSNAMGRFSVERADGVRVADFNKDAAQSFDLWLDAGEHYVRRGDREARLPAGSAGGDASALGYTEVALASRGARDETLKRDLFAVPFGAGFYRGYVEVTGLPPVLDEPAPMVAHVVSKAPQPVELWSVPGALALGSLVGFGAGARYTEEPEIGTIYALVDVAAVAVVASGIIMASRDGHGMRQLDRTEGGLVLWGGAALGVSRFLQSMQAVGAVIDHNRRERFEESLDEDPRRAAVLFTTGFRF